MFVNQFFRGNLGNDFGDLSPQEKVFVKDLDKATDKRLEENQILYRSLDASALFKGITDQEFEALRSTLAYNDNQNYIKQMSNNAMKKLASVYNEKGFMSTTTSRQLAEEFGGFTGSSNPVIARIKTGKSTRGVNIAKAYPSLERRMQQKEVLLKCNQKGKIKKVYGKNGNIYVDIDLD